MSKVPEDRVLIKAGKRAKYNLEPDNLRAFFGNEDSFFCFKALCDMITKYEQPPVDPDVEAVKRVIEAWYGAPISFDCSALTGTRLDVERAVAQYKQERANELRTSHQL